MKDLRRSVRTLGSLLKATYLKWIENDPFRQSAVIAYYTVFSMPGLFLIIFYTAGQFFGDQAVQGEVYGELRELIGPESALQVQETIQAARQGENSTVATIIGILSLVYAATGVFFYLKHSLNDVWQLKAMPEKAWLRLLLDRLFSFSMVLVIGFLLLLSLIISSIVSVASTKLIFLLEGTTFFINLLNFGVSTLIITLLFAAIYKILPDAHIAWKDVWVGALVTTLLFQAGKALISKYIGIADPASGYGAASSIILIMLWASYGSLVFFFGAAFTAVWAQRYGRRIRPKSYAIHVHEYYRRVLDGKAEYVRVESEKVREKLDEFKTRLVSEEGLKNESKPPPVKRTKKEE
jgi:membrane protein